MNALDSGGNARKKFAPVSRVTVWCYLALQDRQHQGFGCTIDQIQRDLENANVADFGRSTIGAHLRLLTEEGVCRYFQDWRSISYSISPDAAEEAAEYLKQLEQSRVL